MLTTRDVIAGKIAVQMGLAQAPLVQETLRQMDTDRIAHDLINRLHAQRLLSDGAIEFLRHRVALYEHVRYEAVYVRLLERGTTVKKEAIAKLLAELEHMAFRRRLGELLVQRGNLKSEYDQKIVGKQKRLIQKDDERILARYRSNGFNGVNKPLIPNSRLEPHEFKISTLFRSKETRALVDKAELELLRAEAEAAQQLEGEGEADKTLLLGSPDQSAGEGSTLILDGAPGASQPGEAEMQETTKLPPGVVAQTKAAMEALKDQNPAGVRPPAAAPRPSTKRMPGRGAPSGSGEVAPLGALKEIASSDSHDRPPREASAEDEINTIKVDPGQPLPGGALRSLNDIGSVKRIADYDVVEVLGVGGMGAVFLGQKEGAGEYCAIKVMLAALASDEEKGRFKREIELSSRTQHPAVLHVIESGETPDGLTYMVVPALAGKELRDLISLSPGNGLAPPLVLTIFRQLLQGLGAVHQSHVVHRDLKPENVFVLAGGLNDIKIMDFGLAKPSDAPDYEMDANLFRTSGSEVAGSPQYIAPESITCDSVDARTDIYSLGIMLFEMLTGKLPLESETTQGYLSQHLICPPLTLEEACGDYAWPEDLEDLLERMLGKTRDERPTTCEEILAELDAGLAQQITHLREKQADQPPPQRTQVLSAGPKGAKKAWGFKGLLGRLLG